MPVAAGIDLVAVEDVRAALESHGDRYLRRVFTAREVAECATASGVDARGLAQRFAAKEAAIKVLRPDGSAVPWTSVEVSRRGHGVGLALSGVAADMAAARRIERFTVTMTLEGDLAAAIVVADRHNR